MTTLGPNWTSAAPCSGLKGPFNTLPSSADTLICSRGVPRDYFNRSNTLTVARGKLRRMSKSSITTIDGSA